MSYSELDINNLDLAIMPSPHMKLTYQVEEGQLVLENAIPPFRLELTQFDDSKLALNYKAVTLTISDELLRQMIAMLPSDVSGVAEAWPEVFGEEEE